MKWKLIFTLTIIFTLIVTVGSGSIDIKITKAEHLDENKEFISDIYNEVKEIDGTTYIIPENQYARAYFEKDLISGNVIDIFVHNSQPATIEIYEKDSDVVVGRIGNVLQGIYYINLEFEGSQDVFDLKSVGGEVVYDYVHDGPPHPYTWAAGPDDSPDPVEQLSTITFTGTGTSDGSYTYQMYICKSATFDKNNFCGGGEWCHDTTSRSTGVNSTCSYTTTGDDSGQLAYYGWIINSNDEVVEASGDPHYFTVNVPDNDPPYFTNIPADAGLSEGESLSVDFNATDDGDGFDSFAINWTTTFSINNTGGLTNTSALSIGTYNINVTINDTANNINSTIYAVTITLDTCTAPGSGNWEITCSDNCIWTTDFTVPGDILITGSGTLTWNANMTMTAANWEIYKDDGCEMVINSGGSINDN